MKFKKKLKIKIHKKLNSITFEEQNITNVMCSN